MYSAVADYFPLPCLFRDVKASVTWDSTLSVKHWAEDTIGTQQDRSELECVCEGGDPGDITSAGAEMSPANLAHFTWARS